MKQNERSIRRAIEAKQLADARARLDANETVLNEIKSCYLKSYILMNLSHAFFDRAQDLMLDNDAYNTHLLGKSNAVKKAMQEYFDAYEKHLKISFDGIMPLYDIVYEQTNKILEDEIHNRRTSIAN